MNKRKTNHDGAAPFPAPRATMPKNHPVGEPMKKTDRFCTHLHTAFWRIPWRARRGGGTVCARAPVHRRRAGGAGALRGRVPLRRHVLHRRQRHAGAARRARARGARNARRALGQCVRLSGAARRGLPHARKRALRRVPLSRRPVRLRGGRRAVPGELCAAHAVPLRRDRRRAAQLPPRRGAQGAGHRRQGLRALLPGRRRAL